MHTRARRALFPAVTAIVLALLLGRFAMPARAASVDPELVAESVSEDGYYVDSSASYLTSDADLDQLRAKLGDAVRTGVVVLPAGASTSAVLSRLMQVPNHKATYVMLTGSTLTVTSTNLSKPVVSGMLARSRKAGDPKTQVLTFLDMLNTKHVGKPSTRHRGKAGNVDNAEPSTGPSDDPSSTPVAAKTDDSGGNGMLYGVGGAVIVVALIGGIVVWRRKSGSSASKGGADA